jgi:predicted Zn-dependent protease
MIRFRLFSWLNLAAAAVLVAGAQGAAHAGPSEVLQRAMEDELERTREELFLEDLERPYFIAYLVNDVIERSIHASDGALVSDQQQRGRLLQVEVRVGDYDFDNSNFAGPGGRRFGGFALLPLEDDYQELRRQIWLATDAAYKGALSAIAGKRAALQNRIRDEQLADFSREEPFRYEGGSPAPRLQLEGAEDLVLELSETLHDRPELLRSDVLLLVQSATTHYLNSEGTFFVRDNPFAGLAVTAGAQAPDGRPVEDHVVAYAAATEDLPDREQMLEQVEAMADRIAALQDAPLLERYNGPVLFEGQAAAELFSQGFAPALIARRAPVGGNMSGAGGAGAGGPFQDKIGARVLPRFLGLVDDPTASELAGQPTPSGHVVDDEGVPAKPTILVERGRLRALLNDRTPTRDITASTGNVRNGVVVPSNLILSGSDTLAHDALLGELMALVDESGNEYGLVVTRLFNPALASGVSKMGGLAAMMGASSGGAMAIEAFRVWPDGRRERVRNVQLVGLSPDVFRDIIAVGDEPAVYTAPLAPSLAQRGGAFMVFGGIVNQFRTPAATLVVPALLFEDFTLRAPVGDNPSLPVVPRPVATVP